MVLQMRERWLEESVYGGSYEKDTVYIFDNIDAVDECGIRTGRAPWRQRMGTGLGACGWLGSRFRVMGVIPAILLPIR